MTTHPASYDVQTFVDGNWRTVNAFRTRKDAINSAQSLEIGPGHQAIRVLQEVYDPQKGRFSHTTIFRRSCLNRGRIDAVRADLAVSRLLRRRQRQAAAGIAHGSAQANRAGGTLFPTLGVRLVALLTGGVFVLMLAERIVTS